MKMERLPPLPVVRSLSWMVILHDRFFLVAVVAGALVAVFDHVVERFLERPDDQGDFVSPETAG